MRRKITTFALLGLLGLVVGIAVTGLSGQRYRLSAEIVLRPDSHPSHAVVMTKGDHPGVGVIADGRRFITVTATGSPGNVWRAVSAVAREVSQNADGRVMAMTGHLETTQSPLGNPVHYGLVGLLAGLSAALGFVVPPKSRVTAFSGQHL
jgi:hypothetical protein